MGFLHFFSRCIFDPYNPMIQKLKYAGITDPQILTALRSRPEVAENFMLVVLQLHQQSVDLTPETIEQLSCASLNTIEDCMNILVRMDDAYSLIAQPKSSSGQNSNNIERKNTLSHLLKIQCLTPSNLSIVFYQTRASLKKLSPLLCSLEPFNPTSDLVSSILEVNSECWSGLARLLEKINIIGPYSAAVVEQILQDPEYYCSGYVSNLIWSNLPDFTSERDVLIILRGVLHAFRDSKDPSEADFIDENGEFLGCLDLLNFFYIIEPSLEDIRSKNADLLEGYEGDIPESLCCVLGRGIMTDPVFIKDPANPDRILQIYERAVITACLRQKPEDPFTRLPATVYMLVEDRVCKESIDAFMASAPVQAYLAKKEPAEEVTTVAPSL